MLKYFQDKIAENHSFQYTLLMDCEEQIANVFWADAKILIDYAHFGDVATFDTTFGFNHFKEIVIFCAAFLYSETYESFKWLFETFAQAHNEKKPRTIFTDQDFAIGKTVEEVFSEAWHGLCAFHIMQNGIKHLSNEKKSDDSSIFSNFSACMFECEDKEKFETEFFIMRNKVAKQTWLDSIYKLKEKWVISFVFSH
jgi:hypothetical protein